jgi:hypothetical protein
MPKIQMTLSAHPHDEDSVSWGSEALPTSATAIPIGRPT